MLFTLDRYFHRAPIQNKTQVTISRYCLKKKFNICRLRVWITFQKTSFYVKRAQHDIIEPVSTKYIKHKKEEEKKKENGCIKVDINILPFTPDCKLFLKITV